MTLLETLKRVQSEGLTVQFKDGRSSLQLANFGRKLSNFDKAPIGAIKVAMEKGWLTLSQPKGVATGRLTSKGIRALEQMQAYRNNRALLNHIEGAHAVDLTNKEDRKKAKAKELEINEKISKLEAELKTAMQEREANIKLQELLEANSDSTRLLIDLLKMFENF